MEEPLLTRNWCSPGEAMISGTQDEAEEHPAPILHLAPSTASEHQYLGGEHEDLRSSGGMLEVGSQHTLHLATLKGVLLFPGSTLPMIIGDPDNTMNVGVCMDLWRVLEDDSPTSKLLAVVNHRGYLSPLHVVGCTAEIRQLRKGNRAGRGAILVGRQRVMVDLNDRGTGCASVTVLPDDYIPPIPEAMKAGYTAWARPAAAPYDVSALAAKARALCAQRFPKLAGGPRLPATKPSGLAQADAAAQGGEQAAAATSRRRCLEPCRYVPANPPAEPLAFSNWLAANLPLCSKFRCRLLEAPSTAHRLRAEVDHLQEHMGRPLRCGRCTASLANAQDMFVSTQEGAGAIFCNEYGYIHDAVTFSALCAGARVRLQRPAQDKHSFYPGYVWWIASCGRCNNHLGWRFRASRGNMRPTEFWGIRRDALTEALPTADIAAAEEEANAARQRGEGQGASIEESEDDDPVIEQPADLLQHLRAVLNQEGDEEVAHNMPRGRLAETLLEIAEFIRAQRSEGPQMFIAGDSDEGIQRETEEGGAFDGDDSYTTASTSVGGEPPAWDGGDEPQTEPESNPGHH